MRKAYLAYYTRQQKVSSKIPPAKIFFFVRYA